jgi:glycosyltransferase involved in cell wall biosynthesis
MTFHHRGGIAGGLGTAVLWAIERACLRRASLIHVLSDFSARQIETLYRIPSERIVKIPAGVDIGTFRASDDRAATRQALGLPVDRTLVLSVRNLEHRMGLDLLLRAIAAIRPAHPDVVLLIGGAGSRRGELEALARDLGIDQDVRFLGFIPEPSLPLYYQAADVFVLPTRELEGFGLVTVEALACGTPVLGTPIGATPEILSPLSPALLFGEASAEAIARGLGNFLDDRKRDASRYLDLRRACRRHAEDHYGWDRAIGDLEALLARLARGTART